MERRDESHNHHRLYQGGSQRARPHAHVHFTREARGMIESRCGEPTGKTLMIAGNGNFTKKKREKTRVLARCAYTRHCKLIDCIVAGSVLFCFLDAVVDRTLSFNFRQTEMQCYSGLVFSVSTSPVSYLAPNPRVTVILFYAAKWASSAVDAAVPSGLGVVDLRVVAVSGSLSVSLRRWAHWTWPGV